jgi:excinuclease ABC subunit C
MTRSELDQIKGVGPKTKEVLLKYFGSFDKILIASQKDLESVVGIRKAAILAESFKK